MLPTYLTQAETSCQVLMAPFSSLGHFPSVLASALEMQSFMLQPCPQHFLLVGGVFSHTALSFQQHLSWILTSLRNLALGQGCHWAVRDLRDKLVLRIAAFLSEVHRARLSSLSLLLPFFSTADTVPSSGKLI